MHLRKTWEGFHNYVLPPYTPETFLCSGYKLMRYGLMLAYINRKSCHGMDVICLGLDENDRNDAHPKKEKT